ncbi:hypothetical protein PR048_021909 [Dryococelus australis]|uniref:Uncharacterized protein n=1 Tax=Dryococelus australis TaxID=614101 RepID=A0ABQ9GZJ4_9NEOP|nr:hypothetical protein PR048_021909 [Dryococelus australis]
MECVIRVPMLPFPLSSVPHMRQMVPGRLYRPPSNGKAVSPPPPNLSIVFIEFRFECVWESCWTMLLAGGFSRGTPVFPALTFQCRSNLGSHFMSYPGMTDTYGSRLKVVSYSAPIETALRRVYFRPIPPEQTRDRDSHESARATRRRRDRTQLTSLLACPSWHPTVEWPRPRTRRPPPYLQSQTLTQCTNTHSIYVGLLASHQGEPCSIPGRATHGFSHWSPFAPALSFRRCSTLTAITLIGSQDLAVKGGFHDLDSIDATPGDAAVKVFSPARRRRGADTEILFNGVDLPWHSRLVRRLSVELEVLGLNLLAKAGMLV